MLMRDRSTTRYRLDLPVTFRWTNGEGHVCIGTGFTRDISIVAMFVVTPADLPPADAVIHCEVLLPTFRRGSVQLSACGRVLRMECGAEMCRRGFTILADMLMICNHLQNEAQGFERAVEDDERAAQKSVN